MYEKFIKERNVKFCMELCKSLNAFVFSAEALTESRIMLEDKNGCLNKMLSNPETSYLILGIEPQTEISAEYIKLISHQAFPWVCQYLRKSYLDEILVKQLREKWHIDELETYIFELQIVVDALISIDRVRIAENLLLTRIPSIEDKYLPAVFTLLTLFFDSVQDTEAVKKVYLECKERLEKEVQQNNN